MRPWHREPMLWLVIALPACAVVAGLTTLWIAIQAGGADSVRTPVSRTAQVQTADLAPDLNAQRMGLAATLERDRSTGALQLRFDSGAISEPRLTLRLAHPTRAGLDQDLALVRDGTRWLGRMPAAAHDWLLELAPGDASWRLVGRLRADAAQAGLRPDLDGA